MIHHATQAKPHANRHASSGLLARARARKSSDGAIIFVTAMTLAVLSSLGLYALAATRSEVRASGYTTRELMTEGMQQWALTMEMSHLNSAAEHDITLARNQSSYLTQQSPNILHGCIALANVPPTTSNTTTKGCLRLGMTSYIGGGTTQPQANPRIYTSANASYNATPDFFTELTDPEEQVVPGTDLHGPMKFYLSTVTVYGMLRVSNAGNLGTGLEVVKQGRAHLLLGPVQS